MTNVAKNLKPRSWRTSEMHERYTTERQADIISDCCPLCAAEVKEVFTHWKIVSNKYPYDAVAKQHDMIITIRHTDGSDLTAEEIAELESLKLHVLSKRYTFWLEAFAKDKSIPGHYHAHLVVPKLIE